MGYWQYASIFYGLPICRNFLTKLPLNLQKQFVPFLNSNQGGIIVLERPHFITIQMILGKSLWGPLLKDWVANYCGVTRITPNHPTEILRLFQYRPDCFPDKVIFDFDASKEKADSGFRNWSLEYKDTFRNKPLSYFVGYYIQGAYEKPENVHDYFDTSEN